MKGDKCTICGSTAKNHYSLGSECDEIYYQSKIKAMKGDEMIGELTKEEHDFMFAEPINLDEV